MDINNKHVNDLLHLEHELINRIHTDITEILRGRGRSIDEIKESIEYVLTDRFDSIKASDKALESEKPSIKKDKPAPKKNQTPKFTEEDFENFIINKGCHLCGSQRCEGDLAAAKHCARFLHWLDTGEIE